MTDRLSWLRSALFQCFDTPHTFRGTCVRNCWNIFTQCYLLPSWWCHPCGLALLPRDCCPVGSPALAACLSVPPCGFRQTSKTPHRWIGRSCRCGPRWRLPPPCPPSPRSFSSCSIQRWAEGNQPWPLCPWRPSIEILDRWRKVCVF